MTYNHEDECIEFEKADDDLIESIVARYDRAHLRQWAWGILSTPARDMPLMVAEDPSVLHVVAAYVRVLEGGSELAPAKAADDPSVCPGCGAVSLCGPERPCPFCTQEVEEP